MAGRGNQELSIGIRGDASGLTKATNQASRALAGLKADVDRLDSDQATIKIDTNSEDVERQLSSVKADVDELDAETIEVSAALELSRINRDIASLNRVLDGIERRKATADADMDITQLLRDEAKVRKALDNLELRKVEIEIEADTGGFNQALGDLDGLLGGIIPGLSGMAGALTGPAGIAAAAVTAATAVGGFGIKLGTMAADVQSSMIQLEALTGSAELGAQVFEDLQSYAAETPFAFDEVTEAAKRLIASGVELEILPERLGAIGDVAAATGAPLEEVAQVFAQIEGKGRLMNEELLQLTERGIPAYTLLADALGVTRGEVEQMATAGELGADAIALLYSSIDETFGGTTKDLAASFNGQMSTLKDTITQAGQAMGTVFLPYMQDAVEEAQLFADALLDVTRWIERNNTQIEEAGGLWSDFKNAIGETVLELIPMVGPLINIYNTAKDLLGLTQDEPTLGFSPEGLERVAGSASDLENEVNNVPAATDAASDGLGNMGVSAEETADAIQDLLDKIDVLNGRFLTYEESLIRVQDASADVAAEVEEWGKVQVTTNGALDLADEGTREVYGSLLDYSEALGGNIEALIQQGASTQEVKAATREARRDFIEAAIAAGIEEGKAKDLADALGLVPSEVETKHSQVGLAQALIDTETLNTWLDNIDGRYTESEHVHRNRVINLYASVTNPGSGVIVEPGYGDQSRSQEAAAQAAALLGMRSGDGVSYPSSPFYSPNMAMFPEPPPTGRSGKVTEVVPKRDRVQVFLDGQQIADALDVRAGRVVAATNRRA